MNRAESYARLKARRPEIEAAEIELALSEAVADLMVDARVRAGLTQAELAKKAGTTQARISEIEAGEANPTLESLAKLASVLGSHVDTSAFAQVIGTLTANAVVSVRTPVSTYETDVSDAAFATRIFRVSAAGGFSFDAEDVVVARASTPGAGGLTGFLPLTDMAFAHGITFAGGAGFMSASSMHAGTGIIFSTRGDEAAEDETNDAVEDGSNGDDPAAPPKTPLAANSELALAA